MLDARSLVRYVLDKGLVEPASLVKGEVLIDVLERKNISFRVQTNSQAYILKQPRVPHDTSVKIEGEVYQRISSQSSEIPSELLPKYFGYDQIEGILILECIRYSRTLREYHQATGRAAHRIGKQFGRALAAMHGSRVLQNAAPSNHPSKPFATQLLRPPIEVLASESAGTIDLIRTIQASDVFGPLIDRICDEWTINAFCHNDVRLDNVLYDSARSGEDRPRITVVDWELAQPGLDLWDVSSFLASYIEFWVTSALRSRSLLDQIDATAMSRRGLTPFHPLFRAFWHEYTTIRDVEPSLRERELTARLVAVRLLQSALEYSQQSLGVTKESLALLEIARRIGLQPFESWALLLGLPVSSSRGRISVDGVDAIYQPA